MDAPMSYHHSHSYSHPQAHPRPFEFEIKPSPAIQMHHQHYPPPHPPPSSGGGLESYYYHHYYPDPNPNPNLNPNPNPNPPHPANLEILTLFIAGLPDDVKPREIHNLFRRRHGFDSCLLEYTGRGNQVVAFATFCSHLSAVTAMNELNGATFDPATGATLHVELARSNSRRRPREDGAYDIIDKRVKVANEDQEISSDDGDGGSDEPSGTEHDDPSKKGGLAANQSGEGARKKDTNLASQSGQSDDIAPCSTLFIANLGPTCTEEELKQVLSEYRGFQTLKMRGKVGIPVAFADFSDVETSTEAMEKLRSTSLTSSDRGDMHVEYARSKMRKI